MSSDELIPKLLSAGDPLHVLAAEALTAQASVVESLRERAAMFEAIARINAETIHRMQRTAIKRKRRPYPTCNYRG